MEWRPVLASLLLLALVGLVLYIAYTVIPAVRDLQENEYNQNVTYSATGVLVREPSVVVDASGRVFKWFY